MYGDIKITLVKTETLAEYVVRTFALERVSLPSPGPSGGASPGAGGGRRALLPPQQGCCSDHCWEHWEDRKVTSFAGDSSGKWSH